MKRTTLLLINTIFSSIMADAYSDSFEEEEVDQSFVYIENLQKQLDHVLEETEKDSQRLYSFQSFMEQNHIKGPNISNNIKTYKNQSGIKLISFKIPISPYVYVLND